MPVATATTIAMLLSARDPARNASGGEPVARPIASSMIGRMSGAISMAPMTTAVLSSASPRVASAAAITSCSQ